MIVKENGNCDSLKYAVDLHFRLNVFVPWNEVVVLDPVKLSSKGSANGNGGALVPDILAPRKFCPDHDVDTMKPLVLATWKHNFQVHL